MGVNSLPKTVIRQHRDCDLNQGPSVPESSTLTTRLLSQPSQNISLRNTEYSTDLHKKSFLIHCLYSFVRWNSFWLWCFVLCVILTAFYVWCACNNNIIDYGRNIRVGLQKTGCYTLQLKPETIIDTSFNTSNKITSTQMHLYIKSSLQKWLIRNTSKSIFTIIILWMFSYIILNDEYTNTHTHV